MEGPEGEWWHSCTPLFPLMQHGGGWSMPFLGCFIPGKGTWYPLYGRVGGSQSHFGQVQNILPPPCFDIQTVKPVASHIIHGCY